LAAGGALGDSLIDQAPNALELYRRHDSADIDCLVQWGTDAQCLHPVANLAHQLLRNALLHQQPRPRTADLSLVEPDAVDQSFDCAVQIGIIEDDERRLATQFQCKPLVSLRRGFADDPSDLS